MGTILVLGIALAILWLLDHRGALSSSRAAVALVRGFAAGLGSKPDSWPRGVQEEDRDRRWGRASAPPAPRAHVNVPLTKVQATLSHR